MADRLSAGLHELQCVSFCGKGHISMLLNGQDVSFVCEISHRNPKESQKVVKCVGYCRTGWTTGLLAGLAGLLMVFWFCGGLLSFVGPTDYF